MISTPALILFIILNVCHWMADYTHLSTKWMLTAKRTGSPSFPIFCHALIHATLMSIVIFIFITSVTHIVSLPLNIEFKLFVFQLCTHFLIDTLKGKINVWFPSVSNQANIKHWYVFGLDQLLHQIVIILMVFLLR